MTARASQIGKWLKKARGDRSRRAVADAIKTTERSLQRWEDEGVAAPTDKFLLLILFYGGQRGNKVIRELATALDQEADSLLHAVERDKHKPIKPRGAGARKDEERRAG